MELPEQETVLLLDDDEFGQDALDADMNKIWDAMAADDPAEVTNVASIDFETIRVVLANFFKDRVAKEKWSLHDSLPRRGKDERFDLIVDGLGLKNNRGYLSRRWLLFKRSKGIYPQPAIQFDGAANVPGSGTVAPLFKSHPVRLKASLTH